MIGKEVLIIDQTSQYKNLVGRISQVQKTAQGNDLYLVTLNPFITESYSPHEVTVLE